MKISQQKRKYLILIALFICSGIASFSQDLPSEKKGRVLYTGFVNVVPDKFKFPLIGFINVAQGSQKNLHLGFVNTTGNNFSGAQISFLNIAGGNTKGVQVGFVNKTKTLRGLQLGFFNYAESVEKGVPIGFFSFVKNGGYRAVKVSMNEMYPMNLSFDVGVKKFYTTIVGSYNGDLKKKYALGLGFGSIIDIYRNVYFNPEAIIQSTDVNNISNNRILSLRPQVGFKLFSNIDVLCGPSLVWQNAEGQAVLNKPFYSLFKTAPDNKNNLIGGANISLKLHLSKRMPNKRYFSAW